MIYAILIVFESYCKTSAYCNILDIATNIFTLSLSLVLHFTRSITIKISNDGKFTAIISVSCELFNCSARNSTIWSKSGEFCEQTQINH